MNALTLPPTTIVVPAFNESAAVGPQLTSIAAACDGAGMTYEIIVVDDGSADDTAAQAVAAGARVLGHPENRGYGASLKTGIMAALYDVIVISDADGSYPSDQIPALVVQMTGADMVVGARIGEQVHVPLIRQPAKWFLRRLATHIVGRRIPDLNSGLRAFRRDIVLQYFPILSNRFSFTTTITLAYLADNYRVLYHPINYYRRVGKSKIVPWNFVDFFVLILRMSMMFRPLRVYGPLAAISGSLGLGKAVYDVFVFLNAAAAMGWATLPTRPVFSTTALLLLFVALQFLMIGMVADGVISRIAQTARSPLASQGVVTYDQL